MIHKIQTSDNNYLSLEVKIIKSEPCLYIAKGASTLTFNYEQTKQLNAIVQSIDVGNYTLKEYGSLKKGSEIYKILISEFRGIKSFQIRQRLISPNYSGFGKQGITLPTYKIKELQEHLKAVMQELGGKVEMKNREE
ncbi:MAG: hypothetical protein WC606_01620 [Candidatus Absconditabacterales bacterium]